jgi:feruloyl esterase
MQKGALTRHPLFGFAPSVLLLALAQCHAPANSRALITPVEKPMPTCDASTAQAAAPPGMKVAAIDDLNPSLPFAPTGAIEVPARGFVPDYCLVTGSVITRSSTGRTVNFGVALPKKWNGKLLFAGCGGLCGVVFETLPDDRRGGGFPPDALAKGYAIVATDDGHASDPPGMSLDGTWALKESGVADDDAVIDFFYRAVHSVAVKSKQLVQSWYAKGLARSYYVGCSDGGRESMVEVTRYPTDFDGYLAGAPFFDIPGQILAGRAAQALLDSPDAFIPPSALQSIDRAVYESCDEADGTKDGLIQNPGNCSFDPRDLLCGSDPTYGCLTEGQVNTLTAWFSAVKDEHERVVSFGLPVSDLYNDGAAGNNLFRFAESAGAPNDRLAPEPWGDAKTEQPFAWTFLDQSFKYMIFRDPDFDSRRNSAVDEHGIVDESVRSLLEARTEAGRADDPEKLASFLASGRKLILYHGYSDGFASPFRTIRFYESWAKLVGGYNRLAEHARLFMVPGMYHCNLGPGPNFFDALGALEHWVEEGRAPNEITATKYADDDCMHASVRTMPLCPFPAQAHYSGKGDMQSASSWACSLNDDLLEIGADGARAGVGEAARAP